MTDKLTLDQAGETLQAAMRDTVKRHSTWYLVQAVLLTLTGVLALVFPILSSVAIIFMLGWLLIISGVFQAISLIGASKVPHFWLQLISVALSFLIGVLFLTRPGAGLLTLTLLLLVFFMIGGIAKITFALTMRPLPNWGWVLASGIIGVLLALYLWASLPLTAGWLLGVLFGIQLICEGVALGSLAWRAKQG